MKRLAFAIALVAASASPGYSGVLTYTFDPPVEAGIRGAALIFAGDITAGDTDTFLNDIAFDLGPIGNADISKDPNFFFANVPGLFAAGDPDYAGPILELIIGSATPWGRYVGTATLLGGGDPFSFDPVATTSLEVDVVPEPGTLLLIGGVLAAISRRGSRSRAS